MHRYRILSEIGSGTFSSVVKAQNVKTGETVAIKRLNARFQTSHQVESLREIQALRRLSNNANIVKMHDVLWDRQTGRLALVFDLLDMNLYELVKQHRTRPLAPDVVRNIMWQVMSALAYMHGQGIFHRDLKPENILVSLNGPDGAPVAKLADFGSCRGIYSRPPYTEYISTRWYRSPECLLTDGYYNHKLDIWGAGCILFETVTGYPLFPGTDEVDQIKQIHSVLGTPPTALLDKMKRYARSGHISFTFPQAKGCGLASLLPKASSDLLDLLTKLLAYNPDDRISARQALRHPYFAELRKNAEPSPQPIAVPAPAPQQTQQSGSVSARTTQQQQQQHQSHSTAWPRQLELPSIIPVRAPPVATSVRQPASNAAAPLMPHGRGTRRLIENDSQTTQVSLPSLTGTGLTTVPPLVSTRRQ